MLKGVWQEVGSVNDEGGCLPGHADGDSEDEQGEQEELGRQGSLSIHDLQEKKGHHET